jgi:hypothetical protein
MLFLFTGDPVTGSGHGAINLVDADFAPVIGVKTSLGVDLLARRRRALRSADDGDGEKVAIGYGSACSQLCPGNPIPVNDDFGAA